MFSQAHYVQDDGVESGVNVETSTPTTSTDNNGRKSHMWCWRIADSRKGCLIVDTVNIFGILFSVLFNAIIYHERHFGGYFAGLLGIVLSCIGGYGAIKFDYKVTGIAALGFGACIILDFVFWNFVGAVIGAVLLYPHAVFTYENYLGILTKQTYSKEEYLMPGVPDVTKHVPMDI
jgi:hypothetical protein